MRGSTLPFALMKIYDPISIDLREKQIFFPFLSFSSRSPSVFLPFLTFILFIFYFLSYVHISFRFISSPKQFIYFSVQFILNELSSIHLLIYDIFVKISSLELLTTYYPETCKKVSIVSEFDKFFSVTRFHETNLTA